MKMEAKFFKCKHCGNIVVFAVNKGVPVMCCGEKMEELKPGQTDGAFEKHVPAVTVDGNKVSVQVGEVEHPMLEEHFIEFIWIETKLGHQVKNLKPGDAPKAEFILADGDEFVAAYEHCNLHGLWKK